MLIMMPRAYNRVILAGPLDMHISSLRAIAVTKFLSDPGLNSDLHYPG